ncbi:hypothetical protein Hanom_Chr01g00036821 [Helianthus anomalus]
MKAYLNIKSRFRKMFFDHFLGYKANATCPSLGWLQKYKTNRKSSKFCHG